jgi:hypothetical protein
MNSWGMITIYGTKEMSRQQSGGSLAPRGKVLYEQIMHKLQSHIQLTSSTRTKSKKMILLTEFIVK